MHQTSHVNEKDVLIMHLWEFHQNQLQANNVRGATLATAYIMFEYLSEGDGKPAEL
jgi:hypothetical protein